MEYRSVSDAGLAARRLAEDMSKEIDLVVCIPRSGLFPGTLLALYLNVAVTTVDMILADEMLSYGSSREKKIVAVDELDTILVVDDSVNTGNQIRSAKSKLSNIDSDVTIEYAALYVSDAGMELVDYYAESIDPPRFFEWNILHHPELKEGVVSLEVLLPNGMSSFTHGYHTNFEPTFVPRETIGHIIAHGNAEIRESIHEWLGLWDIKYNELHIIDEEYNENEVVAKKSNIYRTANGILFIEKSLEQAQEIAELTGKHVYCYENNVMVSPNVVNKTLYKAGTQTLKPVKAGYTYATRFRSNPKEFCKSVYRFFISSIRSWIT